jgi:phage-related tail protein
LIITLAIIAALASLVLIVVAVTAAFKAWQASTPEGKLKAATEKSEELGKQLEETRKRADDLRASFDNYNSIVDELDKCTKGTEEWKEKLKEANAVALETL